MHLLLPLLLAFHPGPVDTNIFSGNSFLVYTCNDSTFFSIMDADSVTIETHNPKANPVKIACKNDYLNRATTFTPSINFTSDSTFHISTYNIEFVNDSLGNRYFLSENKSQDFKWNYNANSHVLTLKIISDNTIDKKTLNNIPVWSTLRFECYRRSEHDFTLIKLKSK